MDKVLKEIHIEKLPEYSDEDYRNMTKEELIFMNKNLIKGLNLSLELLNELGIRVCLDDVDGEGELDESTNRT